MKALKYNVIVAAIVIAVVFIACQKDENPISVQKLDQASQRTTVFFDQSYNETDFLKLLEHYNVSDVKEICFLLDNVTVGFDLLSNNVQAEIQRGLQLHVDQMSSMISQGALSKAAASQQLVSDIQSSIEFAVTKNYLISGMTFADGDETISKLIEGGIICPEAIKYEQRPTQLQKGESLSHESWAPYGGKSDVQKTYTYQQFSFNNLSAYGSTNTYEHETQVYDKNFADYNGYWSSNMPSAYKDTPFLDTIDNFTIGTFKAASLKTYTTYYTYMDLKAGSAKSATVRIKGQKGHRSPSLCYSTWCVFADATTGTMALLNAPSGMSYSY